MSRCRSGATASLLVLVCLLPACGTAEEVTRSSSSNDIAQDCGPGEEPVWGFQGCASVIPEPTPTPSIAEITPPSVQEQSTWLVSPQYTAIMRLPSAPGSYLSTHLRAVAYREVAIVQLLLNNVDGSGLVVDGHYGPATQAAVSAFQATHGHLDEDGVVGEQTARAILIEVEELYTEPVGSPLLSLPDTPSMPDLPPVTVPDRNYTFGGTLCSDGSVSTSSGRGTCSWHGGVA